MTYDKNCAGCHGSLKQPLSPMRTKYYPPVPQLIEPRIPDDPDGNLFYVIKYGVRYTAMPGWDGVLSDDNIWKNRDLHQELRTVHNRRIPSSPSELVLANRRWNQHLLCRADLHESAAAGAYSVVGQRYRAGYGCITPCALHLKYFFSSNLPEIDRA